MGLIDFRPFVRITINGQPLSNALFSLVTSVSVTDTNGLESDSAQVTFTNVDLIARLSMPEPGAEVEIAFGYLGNFKSAGLFVADEIEESSPPRSITVTCRAKSEGKTEGGLEPIHQQKTRSWPQGMTVKSIAAKIASDNGLRVGVTEAAASIQPGHIDQIDESDMSVLTRIALAHDLIAKPTGGVLFVGKRGDGVNASGGSTPTTSLHEADVTSWSMRRSFVEATGTIIATYRDVDAGTDVEVKVGDGEPVRRLRQRFRSKAEAKAAAEAESRKAKRAKEDLSVTLPGNPSLMAEGRIVPLSFSAAAAGEWVVTTATHSVSESGYTTSIEAERL